ncbi:MAG: stage III sporulation protein AF [Dethiobacteria bacterium]
MRTGPMLEIMGDLVRTLVLIAMVGIILDMLVPGDNYRRYLRMVIGLIILLMVIKAISEFTGRDFADVFAMAEWSVTDDDDAGLIADQGQLMLEQNRQKAVHECQRVLGKYLRDRISDWEGWELTDLEIVFDHQPADGGRPDGARNIYEQFEDISLIKVFLAEPREPRAGNEQLEGGGRIRIEAIPPIDIGGRPKEDASSMEAEGDHTVAEPQFLQSRIAELLQVPTSKVKIVIVARN